MTLQYLFAVSGAPKHLWSDNGPRDALLDREPFLSSPEVLVAPDQWRMDDNRGKPDGGLK